MKVIIISAVLLLTGCAQGINDQSHQEGKSWDFDHQVQYDQQKLKDNSYHIIVRSTSRTKFPRLATFLVRHAFDLCKTYGFKIKVLDGVESYNDERYIKSYIPSSLEAKVECEAEQVSDKN